MEKNWKRNGMETKMKKEFISITMEKETIEKLEKTINRINQEKGIKLYNKSKATEEGVLLWIEEKNRIW